MGSCLRRQVSPREPRCSLERAVSVSLSTIVALMVLLVVSFASPPDPSWSAGFYDGADGDDVITLVYEIAAVDLVAPPQVALLRCLPEVSLDGIVRGLPGCCFTHGPRSPPRCLMCPLTSSIPMPAYTPTASSTEAPVTSRQSRSSGRTISMSSFAAESCHRCVDLTGVAVSTPLTLVDGWPAFRTGD